MKLQKKGLIPTRQGMGLGRTNQNIQEKQNIKEVMSRRNYFLYKHIENMI